MIAPTLAAIREHWWQENYGFILGGEPWRRSISPKGILPHRAWMARLEQQQRFADAIAPLD